MPTNGIKVKEKLIVSSSTLIGTLSCYLYAKHGGKDAVPFVMIGGFLGAVVGETIAYLTIHKTDTKE